MIERIKGTSVEVVLHDDVYPRLRYRKSNVMKAKWNRVADAIYIHTYTLIVVTAGTSGVRTKNGGVEVGAVPSVREVSFVRDTRRDHLGGLVWPGRRYRGYCRRCERRATWISMTDPLAPRMPHEFLGVPLTIYQRARDTMVDYGQHYTDGWVEKYMTEEECNAVIALAKMRVPDVHEAIYDEIGDIVRSVGRRVSWMKVRDD